MQEIPQEFIQRAARQARLLARPEKELAQSGALPAGLHTLGLDADRDALLYVPTSYRADRPAPFVLTLHGAGGDAQGGLASLLKVADSAGLLLLSPASRLRTWDCILAGYGPDVVFINQSLQYVFSRYAIDTRHLAISGFSDGASYALSLGLANGDVFTHILAFSPGFIAPASRHGSPHVYISHGKFDPVLAIDRCSRVLVPQLQRARYTVRYHEFTGAHFVPAQIARESVDWFLTDEPGG